MAKRVFPYGDFFKADQMVRLTCRSADAGIFDQNAEILSVQENRLTLDILGGGLSQSELASIKGGVVTVSGSSGYGMFRCGARFEELRNGRELCLRLAGEVEEQQRREHFRMDVTLPLQIFVPEEQNYGLVKQSWVENRNRRLASPPPRMRQVARGYRVLQPDGSHISPQDINLSGGGVRLRMHSSVSPGTLIHLDIFLPLAPPRVVTATVEVLRCNEVTLRLEKDAVFITAMKFLYIDDKDREALISFLFAEQRSRIQSENGW